MHAIKVAALLSGLCMAAAVQPAAARSFDATPESQVSVKVSYSDLDLKTSAGAQALRSRLEDAVTRIKGNDQFSSDRENASRIARNTADAIIREQQGVASVARNVVSVG